MCACRMRARGGLSGQVPSPASECRARHRPIAPDRGLGVVWRTAGGGGVTPNRTPQSCPAPAAVAAQAARLRPASRVPRRTPPALAPSNDTTCARAQHGTVCPRFSMPRHPREQHEQFAPRECPSKIILGKSSDARPPMPAPCHRARPAPSQWPSSPFPLPLGRRQAMRARGRHDWQ